MGLEELGKTLARLGQDTKSGVQKVNESYRINAKIADEKKRIEQLYRAIGEAVYEKSTQEPPEGLEEEFASLKEAKDRLDGLVNRLNRVKGVIICTECGREAAKGEKFCAGCGAKLPAVEEDISKKMKQDAKEAVSEAGVIVNDVVDKARDLVVNVADKADAFVKGMTSRKADPDDTAEETEEDMTENPDEGMEDMAADLGEEAEDAEKAEAAEKVDEVEEAEADETAEEAEADETAEEAREPEEAETAEEAEEAAEEEAVEMVKEAEAVETAEETEEAEVAKAEEEAEENAETEESMDTTENTGEKAMDLAENPVE